MINKKIKAAFARPLHLKLELRRLTRRILGRYSFAPRALNLGIANSAANAEPLKTLIRMQKTLLFWEAVGANPMRWLALTHAFLNRISNSALPNTYKRIALFLSFPVFHAHNLLFKFIFERQQREILRLYREGICLDLNKSLLQLGELSLSLMGISSVGYSCHGFSNAWDGGNECDQRICHSSSNVRVQRRAKRDGGKPEGRFCASFATRCYASTRISCPGRTVAIAVNPAGTRGSRSSRALLAAQSTTTPRRRFEMFC